MVPVTINSALKPLNIKIREKSTSVDDETLIRLVGAGHGVSMMSELMIRGRINDVQCVPVEPVVIRELGMGTHSKKKGTDSIRKLKECMLEVIKELQK